MTDIQLLEFGLRLIPDVIGVYKTALLLLIGVLPIVGAMSWVFRTIIKLFSLKGV